MISPRIGSAAVTTSLFGEFAVSKVIVWRSYSVVLQLFKVEATRLGHAGGTDLEHLCQCHRGIIPLSTLLSTT